MTNVRLLEDLGNNKYLVEIEPIERLKASATRIIMAHDYVGIKKVGYLTNKDGSTSDIRIGEYIQISIRGFAKIILPFFNKHRYTQPEHFIRKDGNAYCYNIEVVSYYEEDKNELTYAVKLTGETEFTYVTEKFFEQFVKPTLI